MKSPVPFLKPKSYYSSPFKTPVIRDEIVPQIDPVKPIPVDVAPSPIIEQIDIHEEQPIIEQPIEVEQPIKVEQPVEVEEQPVKHKKPKQKPTEPES